MRACNEGLCKCVTSSTLRSSSLQIIASFTVREQSAYAAARAVAEEVISLIRRVVAFGGEEKEADR